MDLINEKVIHKTLGEGRIISVEGDYMSVSFPDREMNMQYPMAFESILQMKNESLAEVIEKEIIAYKSAKEKKDEQENKRINQLLNQPVPNPVKHKASIRRENVAFKCNYCDGGKSKTQVGFDGVCSDPIIHNNIFIENRNWCNQERCLCNQYVQKRISRKELDAKQKNGDFVCYESQMLREWHAYAGVYNTGEKRGQGMKLRHVQTDSLCILTTRDPNSLESSRYIFGVFLVDDTYEGDDNNEGYVSTQSEYKIKLSAKEAHQILFWNYHSNDNHPDHPSWGMGLHRYLGDMEALQILRDIVKAKKGTADESHMNRFLAHFMDISGYSSDEIKEPHGALKR